MPINATTGAPTSIDPEKLYALAEFIRCSGISHSRILRAAKDGLLIPTLDVGKRKFIWGIDAMDYICSLAAMHREQQSKHEQDGNDNDATMATSGPGTDGNE